MIFLFISILPFSATPGRRLYHKHKQTSTVFVCLSCNFFDTICHYSLLGQIPSQCSCIQTIAHSWCNIWKGAQRGPTLKSAWDAADEFPAHEGSRGTSYISICNVTFRNSPSNATQHKAPAFNDARESQPFPGCHGAPTTIFAGTHVICSVSGVRPQLSQCLSSSAGLIL
jgi:hypothetical protein